MRTRPVARGRTEPGAAPVEGAAQEGEGEAGDGELPGLDSKAGEPRQPSGRSRVKDLAASPVQRRDDEKRASRQRDRATHVRTGTTRRPPSVRCRRPSLRPGLRALAYRLLGDRTRMDDELQEAYVNAFRGLPRATLRPGLSASPGSPCAKRPADRHSACHEARRREQSRCLRFLERQPRRGLPGVYEAVISGHRESRPVQRIRRNEAPEVTGDDSSRQSPITRYEGVPGSSPGVGFSRFAGSSCAARRHQ